MSDKQIKRLVELAKGNDHRQVPNKIESFPSVEVKKLLREQWTDSGRSLSKIFLKLTEENGNDLYLTGFDGNKTYVGYSSSDGLEYISQDRVVNSKEDSDWETETTLEAVRQNLEEMTKHQVKDMLTTLKENVTKRSKNRRVTEAKNTLNKFLALSNSPLTPMVQTDEAKQLLKKRAFSMYTPGQVSKPVKTESALSKATNRFKNLGEANKAPEIQELTRKIMLKKLADKNAEGMK